MPLVAHNDLPTFSRLQEGGQEVLTLRRAQQQDIRELHIGLLNMMPDAALTATIFLTCCHTGQENYGRQESPNDFLDHYNPLANRLRKSKAHTLNIVVSARTALL